MVHFLFFFLLLLCFEVCVVILAGRLWYSLAKREKKKKRFGTAHFIKLKKTKPKEFVPCINIRWVD